MIGFAPLLAVLVVLSCSTEPEPACTPGETQLCNCAGGAQGAQVCGEDGDRWEPCDCGSTDGDADVDADVDADSDHAVVDGDDHSGEPDGSPEICGDSLCAASEDATTCCMDCGVCSEDSVVRMETGSRSGAPGAGLTPGGMADTHAAFAGGSFRELLFPFTVTEEPVAGSSYFWAQQFFFEGTSYGGYTGLQSNGILGGHVVGKMVIFSIWEALEAEPGPTSSCETFAGEGVGYSCRLAFEWRENVTYRMVLREVTDDRWSLTMIDPTAGEDVLIGTIRVPDAWGRIRPPTAGFTEYYGQVSSCETLPHAVALLHQPIADETIAPISMDAGTYGTCEAQASSVCTGALCE